MFGGWWKGYFIILVDVFIFLILEIEVEIFLILVFFWEGWLLYLVVEIKEVFFIVVGDGEFLILCEVDFKNIGEMVWVLDYRVFVIVSFDVFGLVGGFLVLEIKFVWMVV